MEWRKISRTMLTLGVSLMVFTLLTGLPNHALAAETVKIGILGPMQHDFGASVWEAAQIGAEDINAAGGILVGKSKKKIELIKGDTNELKSINDAVSTMERVITVDKVDFIVGTYRTDAQLAMQEVSAKYRKVYILPGGSSPKLVERVAKEYDKYKYYFILGSPTSNYQAVVMASLVDMFARKIRQQLGIEKPKVALLVEKAVWAEDLIKTAKEVFPQMGMEIVGEYRPNTTATDLKPELTAIANSGAHIIFNIGSGTVGVTFARQWGELKIPAAVATINAITNRKGYWDATLGGCDYEVVVNWLAATKITDKTIPFYNKYMERVKDFPIYQTAGTYDVLHMLKEAIERCGTLDSDAVVAELEKADYIGAAGRIVPLPKTHPNAHGTTPGPGYVTLLGTQWRNGKFQTVWPDGENIHPVVAKLLEEVYPVDASKFKGLRYGGTVDYELPPWMVTYWKNKMGKK